MHGNHSMTRLSRQSVLEAARKLFGYTPNIVAEMSHNVATTKGYLELLSLLRQHGTLTQTEQEIVMLATSAWNRCEYCLAGHRMASKRAGIPQAELDRISRLEIPADRRLQALTSATWALMDREGRLTTSDLSAFEESAIEKAQIYEIVALLAVEFIVHYVDRIEGTPLDAEILSQRFSALPDVKR